MTTRRPSPHLVKVLLVADLHYTLLQWQWVARVAGDYDLVVAAGDHLEIQSRVSPHAQIVVVMRYLRQIAEQTPLLVTSGNHDGSACRTDGEILAPWLEDLRDQGAHLDFDHYDSPAYRFSLCPWWSVPARGKEVEAFLDGDKPGEERRWIWIHHAPPHATHTSWDGRADHGEPALVKWIERHQPYLVLSGHVHEAPFCRGGSWVDAIGDTLVFNSGRQLGPFPTATVFDLEAGTARWASLEGGMEEVPLRMPLASPEPL